MDNLFNDQVVPVTIYDIKKFKKDYSINGCIAGKDLEYDSATNRYFTTNSNVIVKTDKGYKTVTTATGKGDLSFDPDSNDSTGCYIVGYEITDNRFLTSQLLQQNIDSNKLEISQSNFTGYYHRITFKGKPSDLLENKEILERRFYTGIDDGHREDIQDIYYNDNDRVGYYPVFHTDDILELRKKPSEKFVKYFFYSLFTTILLTVITCCTEFWLIYSGDKDNRKGKDSEISIKVENSCKNIGEDKYNTYNCNILEQVFRWRIWNYPYQKCNDYIPPQGGGAKSRYDYYYNEEKTGEVTKTDKGELPNKTTADACLVKGDTTNREYDYRPFPYNIGEKADKIFNSELGTIIPRNVGYVILFIMLMYRYLVYHIFKNVSDFYNRSLKDLPIIKLIIFLASPILISLFINIVPILSTIGVLFFILFMIVQILQVTTDISINLEDISQELLSKDMIVGGIFAGILCYISFIIISKIVLISEKNTLVYTKLNSDYQDFSYNIVSRACGNNFECSYNDISNVIDPYMEPYIDIYNQYQNHNKRSEYATYALIGIVLLIILIYIAGSIRNLSGPSSSGNRNKIKIVFVALLIGVGISLGTLLPQKNSQPKTNP